MSSGQRSRYRVEPQAPGTSPQQQAEWRKRNSRPIDLDRHREHVLAYLSAIEAAAAFDSDTYNAIVKRMGREGRPQFSKARLYRAYLELVERGDLTHQEHLLQRLTLKPVRTLSGVAPVTVLTKPYPCPGKCIFCPTDVRMPKSYLSNEPGAMRALMLDFDPFIQTQARVRAMQQLGHRVDKIELLILGGTWSSYPRKYQEWFVQRCFDALNGQESASLAEAHHLNEAARFRNVGLVIETRPDHVTVEEIAWLRQLGITRVQLGVQSLDDHILALNRRGHDVESVHQAMRLLRGAGIKIAVHWMPNLLGATPESDLVDFRRFWEDPALRPDEMKIYPTGLIRGTELYEHYEHGGYQPYTEEELAQLLAACKRIVPPYCRLNRVMRDIPAPDIAAGVTTSNLRQIVQDRLRSEGTPCRCIRCREVRETAVDLASVRLETLKYRTDHSEEVFISAVTENDRLAGFLRLSLPTEAASLEEINGHALIRQLQVYGPLVSLGSNTETREQVQHQGIGGQLVARARKEARAAGFDRWSVIAAVGTRQYYRRHGFRLGQTYMSAHL